MENIKFRRIKQVSSLVSVSLITLMASGVYAQEAENAVEQTTETTQASDNTVIEEITVYGIARDQELAIATKRNAKQILDAITADDASRLPDNNIAEVLGRLPGVTFLREIDTGDGAFISIRGLDAALNNVQFDGVNSAVPTADTRRAPINGLTADDIAEIRISKSLLPEDEGVGIGGSVNIITKSPLQRGKDRLKFGIEGRVSDFNDKAGFKANSTVTKIINDNFGVNFSASFRRREIQNFEIDTGQTNLLRLPEFTIGGTTFTNEDIYNAAVAADSEDLLDAGTAYDAVPGGTFNTGDIDFEDLAYTTQRNTRDTLTLSGAVDWQVSNNTLLTLGGRYNDEDRDAVENTIRFEDDDRDFLNADGSDIDLDDPFTGGNYITEFGDPEIDLIFEIEDNTRVQKSFYLRGNTELDRWDLKYQASFASSEVNRPQAVLDFDTEGLLDRDEVELLPFSITDTYFPVPNLTALDNPDFVNALADFGGTQTADDFDVDIVDKRRNDRTAVRFDAEYDAGWNVLGGTFNAVKAGAKYERSDSESENIEFFGEPDDSSSSDRLVALDGTYLPAGDATVRRPLLNTFPGIFTGQTQSLSDIGNPLAPIGVTGIPIFNDAGYRRFYNNFLSSLAAEGGPEFESGNFERTVTDITEDLTAAYIQSEFEVGDLTILGGIRVEHYDAVFRNPNSFSTNSSLDISNFNAATPDDPDSVSLDLFTPGVTNIGIQESDNTEWLPRVNAIYQVSDNFQIRAGAGRSLARPTISQLSAPVETRLELDIDRSEAGDTPVLVGAASIADVIAAGGLNLADLEDSFFRVRSGNPNLQNASASNYDLSFEYYPVSGTALTAGLFYKRVKNFIFVGNEAGVGGAGDNSIFDVNAIDAALTDDARTLFEPLGGVQGLIDSNQIEKNFSIPRNGDIGTIRGIELGFVHNLDWAPGIFADMGMNANITFTKSDATIVVKEGLEDDDALVILGLANEGDRLTRRTQFFNSPDRSANASVYYEANGLQIALSGSYQDLSFNEVDDFGLDQFDDEYFRLDLSAQYDLPLVEDGPKMTVFLEIPDFTDDGTKPTATQTIGRDGNLFDLATFNGRVYRFGLRGRF